jgi:NADH-quinone oxidoreductase subunit A
MKEVRMELLLASSVIAILALLLPALFLATRRLGPQFQGSKAKNLTYESGITNPYGSTTSPFGVRFYLVAILFVIFDVEITFMFPWAVNLRSLGWFGIFEMFSFMALLLAGLFYIYFKKALSWQ